MTLHGDLPDELWRNTAVLPSERVRDLMARMNTREKLAQLYGVWVGIQSVGGDVAPYQHEFGEVAVEWDTLIGHGIGQLTRPFGTAPIDPTIGARGVARSQRQIMAAGRFGIPAMVHEECLNGLAAWQATIYPSPLAWGASFDPDLVQRMAAQIGATMRRLGVHQGLAPVLDVVRDLRWGRVEETIGEDPYLVATIGSAYVRGLESAGIVSTLKHFVGYSASRAGRNLAPVSMSARELADVMLPPFEMALRAGARSVMNSYTDIDGVPVAADPSLLTDLLRGTYGFTGTVVADYFAVPFLQALHGVASSPGDAAGQALAAGIDVELPTMNCFGEPLEEAIESGAVDVALVDRALERVLLQKCELGLLDRDWSPEPPALAEHGPGPEIDNSETRGLARELAQRSTVLLRNTGVLPLAPGHRVAVVGPRAHTFDAMLGCYSFPMHVGVRHPGVPLGIEIATVFEALRDTGDYQVEYAEGCGVLDGTDEAIAEAAHVATAADVCVAVLGDRAGLFGAGTSGEGCDATDLRLPGRQEELLEALLATGTPVVLVLLVGRPYEISRQAERLAAAVCAFFPGQEGAGAIADVLSGRFNPTGRLPISFPAAGATQPATYLAPRLGQHSKVSSIDPTALYPFGHGLSYAPATWSEVTRQSPEWPTDGTCELAVTLRNDATIDTTEVVQVYLHDPVADVARPARQLVAAVAVPVAAGQTRTALIGLDADLTAYTGRAGRRQVEPGEVILQVGTSSSDIRASLDFTLTGALRYVGADRELQPTITLSP